MLRLRPKAKLLPELGSYAAEGAPLFTQDMEQAMDVQMADVQCSLQPPSERVAFRAALQVVPIAFPAMVAAPMELQPMQIEMAILRAGQAEPQGSAAQGSAEALDPTAVFTRSEEKLLELATSLPAMRTIRAPAAGPEAKDMHNTQEAVATAHALPSPMDQAT